MSHCWRKWRSCDPTPTTFSFRKSNRSPPAVAVWGLPFGLLVVFGVVLQQQPDKAKVLFPRGDPGHPRRQHYSGTCVS